MKRNKISATLISIAIILSTMMIFNIFNVKIVNQISATIGVDKWQNSSSGYPILNMSTEDLIYNEKTDLIFNGSLIVDDCRLYKPSYHTIYDVGSGLYEVWVNWTRLSGIISASEQEPVITDVNLTVSGLWLVCADNPPILYQVNMSNLSIYDISEGAWEEIVGWFWVNSSEWTVELSKNFVLYDQNETLTITVKKGGTTVTSTGWIDIWKMSGSNPTLVYHKELTTAMEGVWTIAGTLMYALTHDAGPGTYRVSAYEDIDPDHSEAEDIYGLEGNSSNDGEMGFNATFGNTTEWAGRFIDIGTLTVIRDWTGAQVSTTDWAQTTYRWDSCGPFDPPEYWAAYENFTVITSIYVDDDFNESTPGWNSTHFDNIQDGINAAYENGTVYVYNGTYYENVIVNKSINLIGENRNSTFIDGNHSGKNVVVGNTHNVTICGFTMQNATFSLVLWNTCRYSEIYDNIIQNNAYDGISLYCNDCSIRSNIIKNNGQSGISCNNPTFGYCNDIRHNIICNNEDDGIELWSAENTITKNNIMENNLNGIRLHTKSTNNSIYHNNIINNTKNAYDDGNNIWDDGYPSGGNYWSDYTGNDSDGDGIGDTPYPIHGGNNEDRYPLMEPYGSKPKKIVVTTGPLCPFLDISDIVLIDGNVSQIQEIERILNNRILHFILPPTVINVTGLNFTVSYNRNNPNLYLFNLYFRLFHITIVTENGSDTFYNETHTVTVKGMDGGFGFIRWKPLRLIPARFIFYGEYDEVIIEYHKGV